MNKSNTMIGIRPRNETKRFTEADMKFLYNLVKNIEWKDLEIDSFNQQWFTIYSDSVDIVTEIQKNVKCTITVSNRNDSNLDILKRMAHIDN